MKKLLFFIIFITFTIILIAQELQHETTAINIEVPVRVFQRNKFVDKLTIDDFEIYEDGKLQKIEAVYLIKKADIKREETKIGKETARKKFSPQLSRQFVLIFEITDVLPKVEEAIWYFIENVFIPGDKLAFVTPRKTYDFKEESWKVVPKTEIGDQLIKTLRKDVFRGQLDWKIKDLESIGELDIQDNLTAQRYIDEERLINVAEYLKKLPGQKNVFLFLEQELLYYPMPQYSSTGLSSLKYLDYLSRIASYNSIAPQKIKKAFADSSILFQFIYIKNYMYENDMTFGGSNSMLDMIDTTVGMFSTFKGLSKATGGVTHTTANAAASFKKAVDESENYYLLYYSPENYKADGKFRNIKIKVKGKKYRITHRAGYIAN